MLHALPPLAGNWDYISGQQATNTDNLKFYHDIDSLPNKDEH
jgi:hypothetical protein